MTAERILDPTILGDKKGRHGARRVEKDRGGLTELVLRKDGDRISVVELR